MEKEFTKIVPISYKSYGRLHMPIKPQTMNNS